MLFSITAETIAGRNTCILCVLGYSEVLRSRPQQIREFAAGTIYLLLSTVSVRSSD